MAYELKLPPTWQIPPVISVTQMDPLLLSHTPSTRAQTMVYAWRASATTVVALDLDVPMLPIWFDEISGPSATPPSRRYVRFEKLHSSTHD